MTPNHEMYQWDELDLEFIHDVKHQVQEKVGREAERAMNASDFYNRLQEDPVYVYHFDEKYWADYVVTFLQ